MPDAAPGSPAPPHPLARRYSAWVMRHALKVIAAGTLFTALMVWLASSLALSTDIQALMPPESESVQTLERALRKTGSFASIQVVAVDTTNSEPGAAMAFAQAARDEIAALSWVASAQTGEDYGPLADRQLLLMDVDELRALEADIDRAYPVFIARQIADAFGVPATFTLRQDEGGLMGRSTDLLDTARLQALDAATNPDAPQRLRRDFASADGRVAVALAWPDDSFGGLSSSARAVADARAVVERLLPAHPGVEAGVVGRVASQVLQYEAVVGDLGRGLGAAVLIIALILGVGFRSVSAVAVILLPLVASLTWTLGVTALTIGGLNLVTAFLVVILFGLGIDFGIHNTARYREERASRTVEGALACVVGETGRASLLAAATTALAFAALVFTSFPAFSEFGRIAALGIAFAFVAMYTLWPAGVALLERADLGLGTARRRFTERSQVAALPGWLDATRHSRAVVAGAVAAAVFAVVFIPRLGFETQTENLEAPYPTAYQRFQAAAAQVLPTGNSRAIFVADTRQELSALDRALDARLGDPGGLARSVQSLVDFVPELDVQRERLAIIARLNARAARLGGLAPDRLEAARPLLALSQLDAGDLPPGLRRTLLGRADEPGFLLYVDPAVDMDDTEEAARFYRALRGVEVGRRTLSAASESFILLDMLDLIRLDAVRALLLVGVVTWGVVLLWTRSLRASLAVLAPTALGVAVLVGTMGALGIALSVVNMVALPSLIGISVDNGVHLHHRVREGATIPEAMATTGRAAALTTLTSLVGFGSLLTASMSGLRSLGLVAALGFALCLLATWTLLPVLLGGLDRLERRRA